MSYSRPELQHFVTHLPQVAHSARISRWLEQVAHRVAHSNLLHPGNGADLADPSRLKGPDTEIHRHNL
jgi:hypothetical protein